ncbi:ATP-binding protein [Sesbania bispinosa]|nr:ATP-binding protein [Sesbania bispinosa]
MEARDPPAAARASQQPGRAAATVLCRRTATTLHGSLAKRCHRSVVPLTGRCASAIATPPPRHLRGQGWPLHLRAVAQLRATAWSHHPLRPHDLLLVAVAIRRSHRLSSVQQGRRRSSGVPLHPSSSRPFLNLSLSISFSL